jgi:hypothetical protein
LAILSGIRDASVDDGSGAAPDWFAEQVSHSPWLD